LLETFTQFTATYLALVDWENPSEMERRCATLLPALTLARIDGKSPVEYIVAERDKSLVRAIARALIIKPRSRLAEVADSWRRGIAEH
jgi:predicted DNA-binding transcriptional regulator